MDMDTLDVTPLLNTGYEAVRESRLEQLRDRIDLASDQDTGTWLTDGGKRIAAIVPVDVAEAAEKSLDDLFTELTSEQRQAPPSAHEIQATFDRIAWALNLHGVSQEVLDQVAKTAAAAREVMGSGIQVSPRGALDERLTAMVEQAPVGSRNTTLFEAARIAAAAGLDPAFLEEPAVRGGLSRSEAQDAIEAGRRTGTAARQQDLEKAARAGLLSRRHRS